MNSNIYLHNSVTLERVHYFPRQLITAADMTAEQEYFRQKLRRHNRFLHGWGVVCGLEVTAAATTEFPWQVRIDSGYALGPYGDEIYVPEPVCLDLAKCGQETVVDPCQPGGAVVASKRTKSDIRYIAIKYVECETRPVRVHPNGCGCDDAVCEYSRIRDDFKIECLTELPAELPVTESPDLLCDLRNKKALPACPPCPEEPWVVLARVTLPSSPKDNKLSIDNFTVRRQLYSTAMLQEQLIACCCEPQIPPPPPPVGVPVYVVSMVPTPGTQLPVAGVETPRVIELKMSKSLDETSETLKDKVKVEWYDYEAGPIILVDGTVSYDELSQKITFDPADTFPYAPAGLTRTYRVTLSGTGSNAIRDTDNLILDGDQDGAQGPNYVGTFTFWEPPH